MWIWGLATASVVLVLWWMATVWRIHQLHAFIQDAKQGYETASEEEQRSVSAQMHDNWVVELRRVEEQWWRRPVVAMIGRSSVETLVVQRWL